ncbi:MAG: fibronectin type III domain-containing protein [Candidatus Eisenbacteria bacterium]|uniref:Fibronectin type III domain-containing protein n=1 Tax=Eiseniibacteriota bacterium TaxID=2212470 RepID=A0A948RXL3_UNCEI|nr:fibronectin type III domain-containing protein [Candidatus Eisenbacteria bacterium]MBU1950195.1 fibronectin type III domain-containing protein [Candidatus Eisenbacteria bacterium]MBU2691408.1 fibronectin type III domain-containing protein [Candidatus Eisenbacteria bacterium]
MLSTRHAGFFPLLITFAALTVAATGCGNDDGASPQANAPDPAPPTTPSGLTLVKVTEDGLRLNWESSPDLDVIGYEIYTYDPDPGRSNAYVKLTGTPVTSSSYVFNNPKPDTEYYFKVSAVNRFGFESESSSPFRIRWDGGPFESSRDDGHADRPPRDGGDPTPGGPVGGETPGGHHEDGDHDPGDR